MANPIKDIRPKDHTTIVRITGSLTVMNAPELRVGLLEAIKQHKPRVLAINLGEVDFIDSSALGVFVEARRQMIQNAGSVTFTNVNKDVLGLMRIMRLEAVFDFVDDEAQLTAASE